MKIIEFYSNRASETCPDRYLFECFSLAACPRIKLDGKTWFPMEFLKSMLFSWFPLQNHDFCNFIKIHMRLSSVVEMYSIPIGIQWLLKVTWTWKAMKSYEIIFEWKFIEFIRFPWFLCFPLNSLDFTICFCALEWKGCPWAAPADLGNVPRSLYFECFSLPAWRQGGSRISFSVKDARKCKIPRNPVKSLKFIEIPRNMMKIQKIHGISIFVVQKLYFMDFIACQVPTEILQGRWAGWSSQQCRSGDIGGGQLRQHGRRGASQTWAVGRSGSVGGGQVLPSAVLLGLGECWLSWFGNDHDNNNPWGPEVIQK